MRPSALGEIGSVAVTPLPGHGVAAGALILMGRSDHAAFNESEETFARLFAARAGAAMSAARLYAEQAAIRTLMRDLLPPRLQQLSGVELAGGYRAPNDADRVGGDFYDVHAGAGPDEASLVVLGDVCGKGLEAAVQTGKIRNTLHALLPLATDHQRVLRLLNGALLDSDHTRFATLVPASVARRGGTVRLRVTSAGHPAPLVVRADGRVEEAATRGSLVGALPEVTSTTATDGHRHPRPPHFPARREQLHHGLTHAPRNGRRRHAPPRSGSSEPWGDLLMNVPRRGIREVNGYPARGGAGRSRADVERCVGAGGAWAGAYGRLGRGARTGGERQERA